VTWAAVSVIEPERPTAGHRADGQGHGQQGERLEPVDQPADDRGPGQEARAQGGEQETGRAAAAQAPQGERDKDGAQRGVGGQEGRGDGEQGPGGRLAPQAPYPF
jgi:hypothetical protein